MGFNSGFKGLTEVVGSAITGCQGLYYLTIEFGSADRPLGARGSAVG